MRPPRGLSAEEAAAWARVAATVRPLAPPPRVQDSAKPAEAAAPPEAKPRQAAVPFAPPANNPTPSSAEARRPLDRSTLDGTWDRKLARGSLTPELSIDLHGLTLAAAHARLDAALEQALATGARVVLVIAGKARPADERRGAIRARLLDWLAAGRHAARIAAVRPAQPRHGGAGAVYVVLRKAG